MPKKSSSFTPPALEAVFSHRLVLININRSADTEKTIYDAVRGSWKLDPKRAERAEFVLAVEHRLIVGAFVADEWTASGNRWHFIGREAPKEIVDLYVRRRLPDSLRKRGAANPVRYIS
jgi:hypothetical protein